MLPYFRAAENFTSYFLTSWKVLLPYFRAVKKITSTCLLRERCYLALLTGLQKHYLSLAFTTAAIGAGSPDGVNSHSITQRRRRALDHLTFRSPDGHNVRSINTHLITRSTAATRARSPDSCNAGGGTFSHTFGYVLSHYAYDTHIIHISTCIGAVFLTLHNR